MLSDHFSNRPKPSARQSRRAFLITIGGIASASILSKIALAGSVVSLVQATGAQGGYPDSTASIQSLIDKLPEKGGAITIPRGLHYINAEHGIRLRSGVTMNLENGAILRAIPTSSSKYSIIEIYNSSNVKIIGGRIIGERASHLGVGGEWGMGISIRGSEDVEIHDVEISECWGDGIYIGSHPKNNLQTPCGNILIERVTCVDNRRQGLSITSCRGAKIIDSKFIKTSGASPASGIDLEPNKGQSVTDVLVSNCDLNDNFGSGIIFSRSSANSKIINSRALRNRQQGIRMSGATGIQATGNVATDNHKYDISIDKASKSYKLSSNTVSKSKSFLKKNERIHIEGSLDN